jgi:hypothetical protein
MEGHWLEHASEFLVQLFHLVLDGKDAPGGIQSVLGGRAIILEDHHEPVSGSFVDVPVMVVDDFEKAGEVSLD